MDEKLKKYVEEAKQHAINSLRNVDMGDKGAAIYAAKMQARAEAFEQVLKWGEAKQG